MKSNSDSGSPIGTTDQGNLFILSAHNLNVEGTDLKAVSSMILTLQVHLIKLGFWVKIETRVKIDPQAYI